MLLTFNVLASLQLLVQCSHAIADLAATYDYIVLGAGTCGSVIANRLSEDPTVQVAVIEAGQPQYDNPNVTNDFVFFSSIGTDIDWQYPVPPQQFQNGRTFPYTAGKALGGSSTLNGATFVRAQKAQIDAWEQMGNIGWNWSSLFPYYLKSEHFIPPNPDLVAKGAAYEPTVHGESGPLAVSFSPFMLDAAHVLNETYNNVGIPYKKDQSDGDLHGFSVFPSTINSTDNYRADAARSYLLPIQNRLNLHILNGTLADRVLWSSNAANATATGVQIRTGPNGAISTLSVRREVILSAGSHKSPVILENSGIGNPQILSGLNIPIKVNLPAVGENLQDQPQLAVQAAANTTYGPYGYWPFVTYPTAAELFGANTSNVAAYVLSRLPSYAASIAALSNNATPAAVVERQLRIQTDLIFNKSVPCAEILTLPFLDSVDGIFWPLLPFSRGNTHITSRDPRANPRINPQFLIPGIDWDPMSMASIGNLIRKVFRTAPLGPMVGTETMPNTTVVPVSGSVADWMPFMTANAGPNNHPVGTCAMMSKALGGVVDPAFKVYGTSNVRVVDASVLPFQIDGHLTSTLYALSERAADIIRGRTLLAPLNSLHLT